MSKTHTPGPWTVWGGSRNVYSQNTPIAILDDLPQREGQSCIARFPEIVANARLIAAAPDLLEACEIAVRAEAKWQTDEEATIGAYLDRDGFFEAARAAIAKAKGE